MAKRKTIYEQIEEHKEELEKLADQPAEEIPVEEPPPLEEPEKETEKEEEEEQPEIKPDPPLDQKAVANAHFEAREAKRREKEAIEKAEAAQKRIAELESSYNQPKKSEDPEPDPEEEPVAHARWEARQARKEAQEAREAVNQLVNRQNQQEQLSAQEQEFADLEQQYMQIVPDYNDVTSHMIRQMAQSAKMLSPTATNQQIGKFVKQQVMTLAEQFKQQGINPADGLYNLGKTHYGYQPKEQEKPAVLKPDIEKVAKNQKRSASGFGSGASGEANVTLEHAAKMTISELQSLGAAERARLGIVLH